MTDPYLRAIEKARGALDVTCPNRDCCDYGELVRLGDICPACHWSPEDIYVDRDVAHYARKEEW